MITKGMFSSASNEWATPQEFFEQLDAEFHFTLDPCSTHDNAKCEKHYTIEEDGLSQNWGGGYFAILLMAESFLSGLRSVTRRALKDLWLLCSSLRGRIQGGFGILYTIKLK